ncbi:MAG: endonuclease III [Candidatus Eisenbacteria bacterium]
MTRPRPRSGCPEEFSGPLGEDHKALRARTLKIHRALRKAYPDARIPLVSSTPHELLVATILSAQCTDLRVNDVTAVLFRKYRSVSDWAKAPLKTLEKEVHPTGFFRNKARAIKESAEDILERFDGEVPSTLEELTSLRGIGRKSANVLIAHAFDGQGIIVDTHFIRLARRMGLTGELDPVKIESAAMALLPKKHWSSFSLMMTWHGRATCAARKPACEACVVAGVCPAAESRGAVTWEVKQPVKKKPRS